MPTKAAIYTRISSDPDDLALGVERQLKDCRKRAHDLGWVVNEVYTDNDTSAFHRHKPRKHFERMLEALERGHHDAIVCWDEDRLTRHPLDGERLVEIYESHPFQIALKAGEINLGDETGRLTWRIKASVSRHEVEQSSKRIRRQTLERAQNGRPHGKVAYGWRREIIVDDQGRVASRPDVVHPEESAVIRTSAERILAGESLRAVVHDLNERGVHSPRGKPWKPIMLRQVLLRESNVGDRRHRGAVIGKGIWDPILERDTFDQLAALLRDPARRTSRPGGTRYLLSGIARCGCCDGTLRVLVAHGSRPSAYVCQSCYGIRRKREDVDTWVREVIIARLARPDAASLLTANDGAEAQAAREAAVGIRAKLDLVADEFTAGSITVQQLARISSTLTPLLKAAEMKAQSTARVPDLSGLLGSKVEAKWDALTLDRRRAVISALVKVVVLPAGKNSNNSFDPDLVRVTFEGASGTP